MKSFDQLPKKIPFIVLSLLSLLNIALGARKLTSLYKSPPTVVKYHNGGLLQGTVGVSILWYGDFNPTQKSIVSDFLLSLNPNTHKSPGKTPAVSRWWATVQTYLKKAGQKETQIVLKNQFSDKNCSAGKSLKRSQISELAHGVNSKPGWLTLVLTSQDVTVEGFCMSSCGSHGSDPKTKSVFIWVGNSVTQCPGQCAWPFHQPIYGPQTEALGAPNGDVGIDGMIVNIASLLAGTVTNPFGNGYFVGSDEGGLEVGSACPGVYGKGAYPGYAGELLIDASSGASYNAIGQSGRKYLLPSLFDPSTGQCYTLV